MLIEVAFWITLDQVLSISEEGNWRRLLKNENLASEHRLAYVKSLMGDDYAKIVQDCLTVQPSVNERNYRLLLMSIPASRDAPCNETNLWFWNRNFFLSKSMKLLLIYYFLYLFPFKETT
jgi:hypothetical protein